ncbi:FkbM family methyltransferase [Gallionella capsiferriformans]|nr:FkbM family methyltransferase [Gallionella capsiferriformans]
MRYFRWQFGSRLVTGDVLVPFVDKTFLRVRTGMTGATGNIYAGLHEFEDMAFLLHLLRENELFVDVGANIGSYTILAGGAVGARCFSVEPIKSTFHLLEENINLNRLSENVQALNMGIGKEKGVLRFTAGLDTVNHVVADSEQVDDVVEVPIVSLNDLLENQEPLLIKIDVEGFETNVIAGADKVFSTPSLLAVIMELNGSGERYGFDEAPLHEKMLSFGFLSYTYSPFERQLVSLNGEKSNSGNTLYVRNIDEVVSRLREARKYRIANAASSV